MEDFKLVSESDSSAMYACNTDYEKLSVRFDKEMKCVDIHYAHFVFNEPTLEPQWKNETDEWLKHSCHYGNWQSETIICLSANAVEFINKKCKELFG